MRLKLYIFLIVPLLLSSCGAYEKLLKSTDYDLKIAKAKEYFEDGQYVKTTELLEQIIPRYRATEQAEDFFWMNARSFYAMKDYFTAGSDFKSYVDQYPYGKYTEEASFMGAMCDYKIAPQAELDQENTRNAIEGFNVFITRYPNSPRVDESSKLVIELEEKLVEKSYLSAKLYYDMGQYRAAIVALTNSLKENADSKYREEMMFLKLNSLYLYARNSLANKQRERYQATLDDYFSFMEEFPESKYSKDIKKIYQETSDYLKIASPDAEAEANNQ
jgi:outer membrane protein assembly factor BamD